MLNETAGSPKGMREKEGRAGSTDSISTNNALQVRLTLQLRLSLQTNLTPATSALPVCHLVSSVVGQKPGRSLIPALNALSRKYYSSLPKLIFNSLLCFVIYWKLTGNVLRVESNAKLETK